MLENFSQIIEKTVKQKKVKISVAVAHDEEVLLAVEAAKERGIAEAVLTGDLQLIKKMAYDLEIDLRDYELIHEKDPVSACRKSVIAVSEGTAQVLMKGLVDTSILLKEVLNPQTGLRSNRILSHVAVSEVSQMKRLIFMSDGGMNIAPDIYAKMDIILNAVSVARAVGIKVPKVALVCAKEKVDSKMPCTVDAHELVKMNNKGEISNCIVGGPFGLDNAISEEAAEHKGIEHPVAGNADIIIVPNIEAGNVFYKALVYFANYKSAGIIMGAKAPIVLTSRADTAETKLNSIALATLIPNITEEEV